MYSKAFSGAALFSGLALVYAQDLGSLPPCASGAITQALGSTGCSLSDTACICASSAFANIGTSIASACSPEEVNAAIAAGQAICASAPPLLSTTSSPPPADPTIDPDVHDVSYTTIPGTVTSTTFVPETTASVDTTESSSISTMHGNGTYTGPLTTTGTVTVHPSGSGTATGTGAPRQSTFLGDGATEKGHGLFAGAVGLIGAIALL